MKIYSGSSNQPLCKKVGKILNLPLGEVELSRFTNNECRVWVKDEVPQDVIVVQSFSNPVDHHIIEFCLITDALKRQGAKNIIAIIPWLGYSKQDKVFRPGEPLSVKVIANIIHTTPISKIITLDLHNPKIADLFDSPVIDIKTSSLFLDHFKSLKNKKDFCVVSPDKGAVNNSESFAKQLDVPVVYLNKSRDLDSGKVTIKDIDGQIENKDAILLDDMIVTGSTLLSATKFLKEKKAKSVTVAATHHLYLNEVLNKLSHSQIDSILTTDSIKKPSEQESQKLKIISVDQLIASSLN